MFEAFPRYTEYNPLVPIWCVTPNEGRVIHRFFDTSPISPSGRYLAVFRLPFEDRQPNPGEAGEVCVIDLQTGEERVVATSRGWEPQMGANINWGASDSALYFNDVDTETWSAFAWKLNPLTSERRRMEGTVYHASPDGRYLISANMTTMCKTQLGYGVRIPNELVRRNVGRADDDGFYLTDTETGKCRLLVSIRELAERAMPPVQIGDPSKYEIYGFHSKFTDQSDRLMLSLRWFPKDEEFAWRKVRFAWVTMRLDGSEMHCAVGPDQWEKGGHHATWFPDGKRISMNLDIDREGFVRFVQVNADGTDLRKMRDDIPGSGHPTVYPGSRHLLTDTYPEERVAFGDGTAPLRWINLETGAEKTLVRINIVPTSKDRALRLDPHPAWDRTWRYVTFNAVIGGTRRVFIADMKDMIDKPMDYSG